MRTATLAYVRAEHAILALLRARLRKPGQSTTDEVSQRNLREELIAKEEKAAAERAKKERRPGAFHGHAFVTPCQRRRS